jgi:hypothetical protein
MADFLYPLSRGLTDNRQFNLPELGEKSINVFPDREGYLVNYPGRSDLFRRAPPDLPAYVGTPPTTNKTITRLKVFRDAYGAEHVVFVRAAELCRVDGNGYEVLYTFVGRAFDELYYPDLFIHESKLIIANFGDPVLMWDGFKKVRPLGVHETPQAPDVRAHPAPGSEDGTVEYGPWAYATSWWPQSRPASGPSANVDVDEEKLWGMYDVRVQYKDEYGNKGRPSPPSIRCLVRPEIEIDGDGPLTNPYDSYEYLISTWWPPMIEDHIVGMIIGRTTNLHSDDIHGGASAEGLFYAEYEFDNTTIGRYTHQVSDSALIELGEMDLTVGPPPQATGGCSWNDMIFLGGLEDANVVVWSDLSFFGQFHPENQHRLADHFVRAIALRDRVVVISRSSTEVLYRATAGMAILEQDFANGSKYGRSFVDVGGSIFGLWNNGFGFYDGEKFEFIQTPYYIQKLYIDPNFYVHSAIKVNEWYLLATRTSMALATGNNRIIAFNLVTKQWYKLKELVYDLEIYKDCIIGCQDSIYELFRGTYSDNAIIDIDGIIPEGSNPATKRVLDDIKLLMEASSAGSADIAVSSEFSYEEGQDRDSVLMPSRRAISRSSYHEATWNQTALRYDSNVEWASPGDYWIKPDTSRPVTGFAHRVEITFPAGHRVRVKALLLSYGDTEDAES